MTALHVLTTGELAWWLVLALPPAFLAGLTVGLTVPHRSPQPGRGTRPITDER